jgi:hypothetical protein
VRIVTTTQPVRVASCRAESSASSSEPVAQVPPGNMMMTGVSLAKFGR